LRMEVHSLTTSSSENILVMIGLTKIYDIVIDRIYKIDVPNKANFRYNSSKWWLKFKILKFYIIHNKIAFEYNS
jgi:hypothetical protein